MKNLKRMLSLVLALIMLLGMTAIPVGAAPRFADENEIVHTKAVERASERGLFVGANGNFMPKSTVNRAQMATIVVKMMYGSEYNVEPHKKVGKFPDTAAFENGWAEGYINLCSKDGIVVGYDDGYFRPGNQVTAAEAVTMILNAMKVDAGKENWPINVMNKASELKLFAELGEVKSDTVLNRDQLAAIVMAGLDWQDAQKEQSTQSGTSGGSSRPVSGGNSSKPAAKPSTPEVEQPASPEQQEQPALDENNALTQPFDLTYPDLFQSGDVKYSGEQIMIKLEAAPTGEQQAALKKAGVVSLELMMDLPTAKWYKAQVKGDVTKVMESVRALDFVQVAEFDFAYEAQGTIVECKPEELDKDVHGNGKYADQWHLRAGGVYKVWDKFRRPHPGHGNHGGNDGESGDTGSGDTSEEVETVPSAGDGIVVAVIDTGVDYNHEDLKDNIWINTAEIPDDNKDNDGNGYIDDYYGYDAVANKGSGMDDQGHGTHVAGIIAAANNNIGVVGVAYNAKIMPIKAGMASGYFNQSDIAEAIMYAYKNGADVINMSFGGSASSIAVQDALELAYTRTILVAAAGNDGKPNEPTDYYVPMPTYPAALTYVLGVMSVDENGVESSFTNWDVYGFNSPEYEVYAPGDQILSTIPGNRYATWSGTSMATPFVSAVAALIRDEFRDANTYPTKFVYGQICGTGNRDALCFDPEKHTVNGKPHNLPQIVDVYAAMTEMPRPDVGMTDYTLFDTVGLMGNEKNNGDGVIDAGETIALGFALRNQWGMSKDTTITVDAKNDQSGIADPYVTIHNASVNIGQVGTYSTGDCGKVIEDGAFVGWEKPIYITISPDCPNDYIFTLNYTVSCTNALDETDIMVYTQKPEKIDFDVRRGVILPTVIEEDMTLTADNVYIIPQATMITEGTTVTAQPGTQIQFWGDDPDDAYPTPPIAELNVEGTFLCEGTPENRVRLFPSQRMDRYRVEIKEKGDGRVELLYTDVVNPYFSIYYSLSYAEGCEFTQSYPDEPIYSRHVSDGMVVNSYGGGELGVDRAVDCAFYQLNGGNYPYYIGGTFEGGLFVDSAVKNGGSSNPMECVDCVFLGNNTYRGDSNGDTSSYIVYGDNKLSRSGTKSYKNPQTGVTYVLLPSCSSAAAERFAHYVGGYLASFNTVEELDWVKNCRMYDYTSAYFATGARYDWETERLIWADGTEITPKVQAALKMPAWRNSDRWFVVNMYSYSSDNYPATWTNSVNYWLIEIPATVEEITLNAYEVAMDLESAGWQIGATVAPSGAAGAKLIYQSMDPTVAAVSDTGLVTPVGLGTTTIRVYSPDKYVYNTLDVGVKEPVALESISLGDSLRLNVGESKSLTPVLTPADTTKRALVYTTSDDKVATVTADGAVTAVGKGFAVITATNPETGISGTVTVEGYVPTTAVVAEESIIMLDLVTSQTTADLGVSVVPTNSTDTELVWESSNPEILSVDEEGNLIKGEMGTATLRATHPQTGLYVEFVVALSDRNPEITVVQMERAGDYYFALLSDGTLWYWGSTVPTPQKMAFEQVKQFGVYRSDSFNNGYYYYDLLILDKSGTANFYNSVWSKNFVKPQTPDNSFLGGAPMTGVKQVAVGAYGAYYVLREDGTAYAWGNNNYGRLGDGTTTTRSTAVQMNGEDIVQLAAGYSWSILLHRDGSVTGFGTYSSYTAPYTLVDSGAVAVAAENYNQKGNLVIYYTDRVERFYNNNNFSDFETCTLRGDRYYTDTNAHLYVENGKAYVQGASNYIYGTGDAVVSGNTFTPVVKVDKVADAFLFSGSNTFFQTADGKFYGAGHNSGNMLGNLTTAAINNTPTRIYFGMQDENGVPALEGNSLADGMLTAAILTLDYDQGLINGSQYATIKLTDSAGQMVSIRKTLRLDKLVIEPIAALTAGEQYTLTLPDNALSNRFGVGTQALTLTFTAGEVEQTQPEDTEPEEIMPEEIMPEEPVVYTTQVNPDAPARPVWDVDTIHTIWDELNLDSLNDNFRGNAILNRLELEDPSYWLRPQGNSANAYTKISLGENYWGTTNELLIQKQMLDFSAGYQSYADLIPDPILTTVPEHLWPVAVNAGVLKDGEVVTTIGNETVTFFVEFNRDMDTEIPLDVRFGSAFPYADYQLEGEWITARRWEGTTTLTTLIESGYQYFSVDNGRAADEIHKTLYKDWGRFWFEIDTSDALAMTLQGNATDEGIALTWYQDDFDTLAGYNVYRADKDEDAFYQKLNTTVIPFGTEEFFDDTVEPGKVYYYTFTVVKTDLSESSPSGKIRIVSKDTMAPVLYHTPVYQTYAGRNVVITATATDNVALEKVQLHYTVDGTSWITVDMSNLNSSYSAVITGNNVTEEGVSYYVTASDGVSTVSRGSAENPYVIVVQPDPGEIVMGDVDGDGYITILDALLVLRAANNKVILTAAQFERADLDGDGLHTAAEALKILKYANGEIGSLQM